MERVITLSGFQPFQGFTLSNDSASGTEYLGRGISASSLFEHIDHLNFYLR